MLQGLAKFAKVKFTRNIVALRHIPVLIRLEYHCTSEIQIANVVIIDRIAIPILTKETTRKALFKGLRIKKMAIKHTLASINLKVDVSELSVHTPLSLFPLKCPTIKLTINKASK